MFETASERGRRQPTFESISLGPFKREQDITWLSATRINERYYVGFDSDVVEALTNGHFVAARHHYIEFNYFEDRLPFLIEVDEAFHFCAYPEIQAEVIAGSSESAKQHFALRGNKEGRLPREGGSLEAG